MNSVFNIIYFPPESITPDKLTYVIIGARENGNWIFVRHKERDTWELPAGHIEKNETIVAAAKRELFEETGTTKSMIRAINDYTVSTEGQQKSGRLFFAEVIERGFLPEYEIAEIKIQRVTPQPATYPEAHNSFIDVLEKFIGQR